MRDRCAALPWTTATAASAQNDPVKPVRIPVGFAPGRPAGRVISSQAQALQKYFGQPAMIAVKVVAATLAPNLNVV